MVQAARERALEVFNHPFAYAQRATQGEKLDDSALVAAIDESGYEAARS